MGYDFNYWSSAIVTFEQGDIKTKGYDTCLQQMSFPMKASVPYLEMVLEVK